MKLPALFAFSLVLLFSCSNQPKQSLKPGENYLEVPGGRIWYRVAGEGDQTPVLMVHGGPGFTSYYLTPLVDSLSKDRPVIVFDQLGCGRSTPLTDTSYMTMENHMAQLSALLKHLGVGKYILYGHSFGTMLATDFYLQHPENIERVVLASPCMRARSWELDADTLMMQLPDTTRQVLLGIRDKKQQDSLRVVRALDLYYGSFYNRAKPLSPYVDTSLQKQSLSVYRYMWGIEEFAATGTLKNYDRLKDLGKFKVPVLFTAGTYDAARPPTVRYYASLTPGAQFAEIPDAGHSTMTDNLPADLLVLRKFLGHK